MNIYLFQLGRNVDLSVLEIFCSFEKDQIVDSIKLENYLVVDFANDFDPESRIRRLAGIIKCSIVVHTSDSINLGVFDNIDFYFPKNFNLFYSSSNNELSREFSNLGSKFLHSQKLKGQILDIKDDYFKPHSHIQKDSEANTEIQILQIDNTIMFGKVFYYANPDEFKKMDMERPDKKVTHGTSFRTAKIMINILNPNPGDTVVDPFCGTGTFLIEAFKRQCNVVGIDNAQHLIQIATKNINWYIEKESLDNKFKLICKSSTEAEFEADHIVFEPYMGEFLSELPTLKRAKATAQELHGLYIKVLKNMHKHTSSNARMVCVIPYFNTKDGQVVNIPSDLFTQAGFEIVAIKNNSDMVINNPVEYSASDGSYIGRKIYFLQKK